MGVTRSRESAGTLLAALALSLVGACGREPRTEEPATSEHPLVIDAPRLVVASGPDTTVVMGPTVFGYFGVDPGDDEPTAGMREAALAFQAVLREAEPGLRAMRVQIVQVEWPPVPLGIPPARDEAAGRRLSEGGVGFLLVDPTGRIRRIDRLVSGTALVCAAAATFDLPPPAVVGRACG